MSPELLYQWTDEIAMHFPVLNSYQQSNLALFSLGVIESESSQQRKIAKAVVEGERVESVMRRLRRFIANDSLALQTCFTQWTRWVMQALVGCEVHLLVDETKLADRLGVMVVGLAWEGRCIPLAWRCYRANSAEDYPAEGQVEMIVDLLRQVKAGMPDDQSALVMADRGIGTSPELCRAIDEELNWRYLFRVTSQSKIVTDDGNHTIAEMVQPGEIWTAEGRIFKQRGQLPGYAHALWSDGYDEPWALVSNDGNLTGYEYAERNWEEQGFRDLKSHGWQWEASGVTDPQHMDILMLILAVAYGWTLSLGSYAVQHDRAHRLQRHADGSVRRYLSLFNEGLTLFAEWVRKIGVCLKLCFAPDKRFT